MCRVCVMLPLFVCVCGGWGGGRGRGDSSCPVHYRPMLAVVTAAVAMTAAVSPAVQRVSGMPHPHLSILTQTTACWTKKSPTPTEHMCVCVCVCVCVCLCVCVCVCVPLLFQFISSFGCCFFSLDRPCVQDELQGSPIRPSGEETSQRCSYFKGNPTFVVISKRWS